MAVCTQPGCPELVARGRCPNHQLSQASRNHHGVPRQQRGHGADYERVRQQLLGQPCHWCGKPATTADYAVPWVEGGTLEDLVPACGHCNYARGARLAADRRRIAEREQRRVGGSIPRGRRRQRTALAARKRVGQVRGPGPAALTAQGAQLQQPSNRGAS